MRKIFIVLGAIIASGALVFVGLIIFIQSVLAPSHPKFGFSGNWRVFDVFGVEERPLPTASEVWRDYNDWKPKTNEYTRRVYLGRLGGVGNQLNFYSSTNSGDTPLGAQNYTSVEFAYQDPINGSYALKWDLRGKHNTDFLRFDDNYPLYQLQPYGNTNDYLAKLSIVGIEGIKPEY